MPEDQAQPQPQAPEVPQASPDALSGLWDNLKQLPGKVEGGLEGLWSTIKEHAEGVGKQYGEALAERSRPDITPMRGGQEIRSTAAAPEGEPVAAGVPQPGTLGHARQELQAARGGVLESPAGQVALGFAGSTIGRGPGIPGVQKTTALPPGTTPGLGDIARNVSHAIETQVSPTTVDIGAQEAERLIDRGLGKARRETTIANTQVEGFRKLTAPMQVPFQQHVTETQANLASGLPPPTIKPDALQLIDYMEGRSAGAQLPPELAHVQPLADTLRRLYKEREAAILSAPNANIPHLIEDYFSHQWKERPNSATFQYGTRPRMGSGSSLKARSIPTLSEGIERGLTPTSFDPIEMTMRYIGNMDRFLAANEIFETGRSAGIIKFHDVGKAPDGWAPLNGRMAGPNRYGMQAHAPEGFARVYNNSAHVDPGWQGSPVYNAFNMGKNALTQTLLGFSGYHPMAIAQESVATKFSAALGELSEGELREAAEKAGVAAVAPITQIAKGQKLRQAYLRQLPPGPANAIYDKVADLVAKAGGRIVGKGEEWRGSAMDDYFTAWRRGSLVSSWQLGGREITQGPVSTLPFRAVQFAGREMGRLMETLNKPLFDEAIPRLKGAAFFDEMEGWLRSHPNASPLEEEAQARMLWDAVDDRFGQMVMDRIFWRQQLKQGLQQFMVSPGWELGSARALGGGLTDLALGKWRPGQPAADLLRGHFSPRTRWLMMFPVTVGLHNAIYQYLRTGEAPNFSDRVGGIIPRDLLAPRTGGRTPEGKPERAILPGYIKDPLGWFHDPGGKVGGMMNPQARTLVGGAIKAMTGRGDPFQFEDISGHWGQWAKRVLQSFEPIGVQQMQRALPGSQLGLASTFAGIRPAPGYITDPQRTAAMTKLHELGEEGRQLFRQEQDARRRGDAAKVRELQRQLRDNQQAHRKAKQELNRARTAPIPP